MTRIAIAGAAGRMGKTLIDAVLQSDSGLTVALGTVLPDDPALDGKWSPAEVNQILFRNFGNPEKAVEELVSLTREDLYGFSEENGSVESSSVELPLV